MKPQTISEVRKFLSEIPYINAGGCGIAALAMYRWLRKNGDSARIVFAYQDQDGFLTNERAKKNNKKNNKKEIDVTACSHAGIKLTSDPWFKNIHKFIDCNDTIPYKNYAYHHFLEEEVVLKSINEGCWNSMFDRHYIKKISTRLGVDLSDI